MAAKEELHLQLSTRQDSREMTALAGCIEALALSDNAARWRILNYLNARFYNPACSIPRKNEYGNE